jgi:hypothetical protein
MQDFVLAMANLVKRKRISKAHFTLRVISKKHEAIMYQLSQGDKDFWGYF